MTPTLFPSPSRARPAPADEPLGRDELFLRLQAALAGEYSIDRELGRGGMGVVYLAREVRLAREVAIKVLPPDLARSAERREQFLREAQIAARLSHPHIVPIHRVDETGGFVYFVMAYVPGETLAQRIREHGPLPPHQAARVLREVSWALTYAHAAGIVHRDIKADNILLERGTGRALVTDFGIANVANADARSADGHVAGSAHYASPEQIAGQPVDASSDLYSLGVVGFLALTGRLPFDAASARDVVSMHLTTRPPAIASLAPTVPTKLGQIVERCLAKRPEHRFGSAAAFAEAIEQAVEPPREIPPAIRVWLARGPRDRLAGGFLAVYAAAAGILPLAFGHGLTLLWSPVLVGLLAGAGVLPAILSTTKVLKAGYGIDDLRAALQTYWAQRREEAAYELASGPREISKSGALKLFGVSAATTIAIGVLAKATQAVWLAPLMGLTGTITVATGMLSLVHSLRLRVRSQLGARQIKFYDGKWGERFVRLAGIGVKKRAPDSALPQLTEVALGRATDALYDALPKTTRKHLKDLPAVVRRLESDARILRAELEKLDASIGTLDTDARALPSALTDSAHAERLRTDRDRLRHDLRLTRERAGDRLAATVAALENIRLDLLRLQLGDGHVDMVTESLEAAQQVAADLSAFIAATREVESALREEPPRRDSPP